VSLRIQLPLCHFHSTFTYCAVSIQWQRFERLAYSNRLVVNVTLNWGNLFNPKSGRFRRTFWTACSRQKFSGNFKTGLVEVSRQYCLVCLFLAIVKFTQNTQPFCIFAPAVLRCLGKQERTRDIWENRREPEIFGKTGENPRYLGKQERARDRPLPCVFASEYILHRVDGSAFLKCSQILQKVFRNYRTFVQV